ncbi:hypothetical protein AAEU29_09535 [Pseudoalteromonas sp. SSM20]|uniref:hypothetical protein n=1 Tax=Pseudoalteromonas sp. SSM20 TaxID=3139394 RepID=UPI003BA92156
MQHHSEKSSTATIQNGVTRADGQFSVSQYDICFKPFNEKLGLGPYKFERSSIAKVEKCVGKGAGILPISSDAIRITCTNNETYEFIISNPDEWVNLLSN